jgi:amidohydrolase
MVRESKSVFRAEAVSPQITRRSLLGLACACCAAGLLKPVAALAASVAPGEERPIHKTFNEAAAAIEEKMIGWRRDIHQNPELGNQETRTAKLVADHLKALGYEVKEGVAVTGVVGVLKGEAGDGPVVALRADMDALPVTEEVDLPFASKAKATYLDKEVGVMHACGHDCHVAILMAVAEVLAKHKAELKGTVKLLFQPAEEGLPNGEIGGARLMVEQGVMENPKPDAVFGLHVMAGAAAGKVQYLSGPVSASSDTLKIVVTGKQTHGAMPWNGVDPIAVSAQIITALQTLISRETNLVAAPSVLTIGTIDGGVRHNIIPDKVEMTGTFRTYDDAVRERLKKRLTELASSIAEGMNAKAEVTWQPNGYPSIIADAGLVERMAPSLVRAVGEGAQVGQKISASEDFSYFAQKAPGMFFFVGISKAGAEAEAAPNHSPHFEVDEAGLLYGLRGMLHLVADFTGSGAKA